MISNPGVEGIIDVAGVLASVLSPSLGRHISHGSFFSELGSARAALSSSELSECGRVERLPAPTDVRLVSSLGGIRTGGGRDLSRPDRGDPNCLFFARLGSRTGGANARAVSSFTVLGSGHDGGGEVPGAVSAMPTKLGNERTVELID